jgi:hypothetical protein
MEARNLCGTLADDKRCLTLLHADRSAARDDCNRARWQTTVH